MMDEAHSSLESPRLTYARLLRKLHDLIAAGQCDSQEADTIRDEMDNPWDAMAPAEQERLRGLSEDLYTVAEGRLKEVEMSPTERTEWGSRLKAALAAFNAGDADAALVFLRRPMPRGTPFYAVVVQQAQCWILLGDLDTALFFLEQAERLGYRQGVPILSVLEKAGRTEQLLEYAKRLCKDRDATPEERYLAAATLLLHTPGMSESEARKEIEQTVIPVLRSALQDVQSLPANRQEMPEVHRFIALTLGFSCERLGKWQEAVAVYTGALGEYPGDADLLAARGIARYDSDRPAALRDFEGAVQRRCLSLWPYYLLAHHAIENGDYNHAWQLCLAGIQRGGPDRVLAQLYEWLAIAQSMLGQPTRRVLELFDRAEDLDPASKSIRQNREIAERRAATSSSLPQGRIPFRPPTPTRRGMLSRDVVADSQRALEQLARHRAASVLSPR